MRWRNPRPRHGDVRNRRVFLWLPKEHLGEVRWLEKATVVERYFFDSWCFIGFYE